MPRNLSAAQLARNAVAGQTLRPSTRQLSRSRVSPSDQLASEAATLADREDQGPESERQAIVNKIAELGETTKTQGRKLIHELPRLKTRNAAGWKT